MNNKLWFTKPAKNFNAGLPIGNGRLAAMILGDPQKERIALNHEWLWRGKNKDRKNEQNAHKLQEVRELLLNGEYEKGTLLANKYFAGNGGMSPIPSRINPYQPVGDFFFELDHGKVENYKRELDLNTATVTVSYETEKDIIIRQAIVHPVHNLIVIRIKVLKGSISGRFYFNRVEDEECCVSYIGKDNEIFMEGTFTEGINFKAQAAFRVMDGTYETKEDGSYIIKAASEVIIFISIGTSVNFPSPDEECNKYNIPQDNWEQIHNNHIEEYSKVYNRLNLWLPYSSDIPTDTRLLKYKEGGSDPGLALLYFNFGRYLLYSSTIKGELPPNLQGKWNEDIRPAWDCDYHHDINLQMNFWPAEAGNIEETTEALFAYMERLIPEARSAAKDMYGCEGILFPIMNDIWSRATAESYGWSVWIGAAPWLSQHFWWHYEFSQDLDFLRDRAYPFLKEVAAFYESYIKEDKEGNLQIVPSQSPENRFTLSGELPVSICVSSTMDIQLASEVLSHTIEASKILGIDLEKQSLWEKLLSRLPKMKIGNHGQLLEWNEEFIEVEPEHRHISHLFGLYPGENINEEKTPDLFEASRISLENRLASGGGHTGWSRAWTACCYARLGDKEKAWEHLEALLKDFQTDSLLDLIPPDVFQIEGNFGGTAAILEMLLQSYYEQLHFLPALPKAWKEGKIIGLRARGGFYINIEWKNEELLKADIIPSKDMVCKIKAFSEAYEIRNSEGSIVNYDRIGNNISFSVKHDLIYSITKK